MMKLKTVGVVAVAVGILTACGSNSSNNNSANGSASAVAYGGCPSLQGQQWVPQTVPNTGYDQQIAGQPLCCAPGAPVVNSPQDCCEPQGPQYQYAYPCVQLQQMYGNGNNYYPGNMNGGGYYYIH